MLGDLLSPVDVKEISIQNSLDDTCNDGDGVIEPRHLEEISVDPIRDVQCSVRTKCKEVMSCDCFRFASSLKHKELWQDSDWFKPDRERPEDLFPSSALHLIVVLGIAYLGEAIFVRKDDCQNSARSQQVLHFERVEIRVMGGFVVVKHQVDGVCGCTDENDLEDGVIKWFGLVKGP